jgi:hypothetical protein
MADSLKNDRQKVVDLLTEAFDKNNSTNYVVTQDRKRKNRIARLISYSVRLAGLQGHVLFSEEGDAAAILHYPNRNISILKKTYLQTLLAVCGIGVRKIPAVLRYEAYADRQGTKLLAEIAALADRVNLPVYLETSYSQNIRLYKRFNFEVFHTWRVEDGGFDLSFLRRPPVVS